MDDNSRARGMRIPEKTTGGMIGLPRPPNLLAQMAEIAEKSQASRRRFFEAPNGGRGDRRWPARWRSAPRFLR